MWRNAMSMHRVNPLRLLINMVVLLSIAGAVPTATAAVHLWQIKEVFSNADGSVQFIEMFDNFPGEVFTAGTTLQANSDGVIKSFTLSSISPKPTQNRHMLFATPGFSSLAGGIAPDFTFLPATLPFINPNANNITITFSGSGDSINFTGASLPKNGINSLTDTVLAPFDPPNFNLVSGVNSPFNLANQCGSVNPSGPTPTGDYNCNHIVDGADYVVWRNTQGQAASPSGSGADGDASGTIDASDYTFWRSHFGNPAGSGAISGEAAATPEPTAVILLFAGLFTLALRCRKFVQRN